MELVSDLNTNINIEGNVLPDLKYLICALSFHNSPNICSFFWGGGKGVSQLWKSLGVTPYRFINIYQPVVHVRPRPSYQ